MPTIQKHQVPTLTIPLPTYEATILFQLEYHTILVFMQLRNFNMALFFIKLFLLLFSSIQRLKIYSVSYSYCLYISLTIPRILSIKESGARIFKDEPYESNSCTKSSVGRNLIRNVIESSSCDIRT